MLSTIFSRFVLIENLKQLQMRTYDIKKDSLRMWLKEFEQQAAFIGIENMDNCIPQFGRFMPTIIRNYLPTIPYATRSNWSTFTAKILSQFGIPEDEENRHIVTQLRQ
ncbi:hypothetical protein K501DRAFT_173968, partial [Backusella circina FSU 941]